MKTVCIYHSRDLDGWMSAAIVKKWFEENHKEGIVYRDPYAGDHTIVAGKENETSLSMYGFDYGDEIPNLKKYDKIIMCDVSFGSENMDSLYQSHKSNFVWIDHHISAIKALESLESDSVNIEGLRDTKFAACELTWKYFFLDEKMPEIVRLLGRYDCFGHKGTDEEQKVLEFQYAARGLISNYDDCFQYLQYDQTPIIWNELLSAGKGIYKYLCTEAKQTYKKAFPIIFNERMSLHDDRNYYNFLCVNQERFNPINFGIDYHKDDFDGFACFWYKEGKWHFSLYNDNGNVDCSVIAKYYGGGGHKGAAGFVIEDLKQIIK